jgi:hypothetical protein
MLFITQNALNLKGGANLKLLSKLMAEKLLLISEIFINKPDDFFNKKPTGSFIIKGSPRILFYHAIDIYVSDFANQLFSIHG